MLDLYRVLKDRFQMRGWVVSLVDLLYWAMAAGMVFGLLLWSNWGELRFTVLVAILVGWLIYHSWFSNPAIRLLRVLLTWVERVYRVLLRLLYVCLWLPVVMLWMLLYRLVLGLSRFLWAVFFRFPLRLLSPLFRWLQPLRERLSRRAGPIVRQWKRWKERLRRWLPGRRNDGE